MQSALNRYFSLWALLLPITSVVIIPSIPGTTPGLLMGIASVGYLFLLFLLPKYRFTYERIESGDFFRDLLRFTLLFLTLVLAAQLSLSLTSDNGIPLHFDKINLVSSEGLNSILFRSSLITQSFYLLVAVTLAVFVKNFYSASWNRIILYGATLLALYGLYEFIYFLVFHSNGDFLSNRIFISGEDQALHSGSLFQTMNLFGTQFMRLKSLTGEPSMFSFTMLPLWIFAIHLRRTKTQLVLLLSLILTFSTTAFIGISLYFCLRILFFRLRDRYLLVTVTIFLVAAPFLSTYIQALFNTIIGNKTQTYSGMERQSLMDTHLAFFNELPFLNKLFGVGFGYVRSADLWSTFLCNIGIVGTALFTLLFLVPVLKLKNDYETIGIKCLLIVIYFTAMISVSEFAYLTIWLFVGIAYAKLKEQRQLLSLRRQYYKSYNRS
ncbi:hypothetical protein KCTCHS21_12000 [Cohnella abietis]|uniref:Uncharacterized protein n=2 Tax=Cohnella abietis TaxID=2507935 RepID=A0A3T1D168_9BACL|nr:hypothetical protein KCTCHS21_12000 [Cohnella abietis]